MDTHFERILSGLQDSFGRLHRDEYDFLIGEYGENRARKIFDYPFIVKHNFRTGLDALENTNHEPPFIFYGNGSSYINDRIQRPTGFVGETLEILVHIVVDQKPVFHDDKVDEKTGNYNINKNVARAHEAVRMIIAESQRIGNFTDEETERQLKDDMGNLLFKQNPDYDINDPTSQEFIPVNILQKFDKSFNTKEVRLRRRFNFKTRRHAETGKQDNVMDRREKGTAQDRELLVFSVEVDRIYRKTN